ncbi:hypothetical protein Flexsi_1758 [Flexistipes sinusarabici DSM 4947]|uniref:RanBP2-type domain-containing protein n=1 Tax=Flexistipes sinusarabici (strain ATCC 49648 / DSM 4947 / MAS 10) TaxID=717231 RepID=F8E9Y7_FLESM|nr:hypothetical protein [Flexistipes sinusarabici]AEI15398.1 hypothetical protein Flexsi_1758 [Flexistipes sinusarabici DSM 4947]
MSENVSNEAHDWFGWICSECGHQNPVSQTICEKCQKVTKPQSGKTEEWSDKGEEDTNNPNDDVQVNK